MITFVLLGFFFLFAIAIAIVAYTSNNRRRAGMKGTPTMPPTGTDGESAKLQR